MGWFDERGIIPFVPPGQQVSGPQVQARPPTASLGVPGPAPAGFDAAKWADPTQGTTRKYTSGRQTAAGVAAGTSSNEIVNQFLAQPGNEGFSRLGDGADKVRSPTGAEYDLIKDEDNASGQRSAQYTRRGGTGSAAQIAYGREQDMKLNPHKYLPGGEHAAKYGAAYAQQFPEKAASYAARGITGGPLGQSGGQAGATQNSSSSYQAGNPSGLAMPTAPTLQTLTAPSPFEYQALGNLGQTPTMAQQSYNPAATPQALSYENLATPEGYQAKAYEGMTAEQLQSDPSYQFRLKAGADALENSAASRGVLRTGNTAKGLIDYGQGAASQEYAAADQRARATNQMNNATSLGAYQTNAQTGLAYNQNANQNAMQFGQANIQNAFQANQANNQGSNAAIAANNQSALAQQNQSFNQGLGAQQQQYAQGLGAYQTNAGNTLAFGQANNQSALANYQAQTNAALGVGNLNLGYTQAANSYDLGKGNLALGQGQLAQQGQNQAFNQAGQTYDRNYRANVTDPWSMQAYLAGQGNPGAPNTQGYGNAQSDLYTQQGNAASQGQISQGDAYANALGQVGNLANYGLFNRPNKGLPATMAAADRYDFGMNT